MKQKILIVGGVAGGASAAARLRRLSNESEIIIFERGEYISFANCGLPYHIGGVIENRDALILQSPESFKERFNIEVRVKSEVMSIDRKNKSLLIHDHATKKDYHEHYDKLILSPGAEPIKPPLPGIELERVQSLRNLDDMDQIMAVLAQSPQAKVAVVGGGYIGLEMIEALLEKQHQPILIEMSNQIMNAADPEMVSMVQDQLRQAGAELKLNQALTAIKAQGDQLCVTTSREQEIYCDMVVLAIGVKPEIKLAREAELEIGESGGIRVNDKMVTNDPDVYAVGDAIEVEHFIDQKKVLIPLAGPANRQGRIAADNIMGRDSCYQRTQGTAVCKVLRETIAVTGINEKQLKRNKVDYRKIYIHPFDHATYYPGAKQLHMKLLFTPAGRLLGAQAVGQAGVDKRIDVLATAMRAKLTVFDLEELELAYAPPYGSAKDPVNFLGFVASNWLRGDTDIVHSEHLDQMTDNQKVLDVRTEDEIIVGAHPNSINIPIDELRERISELDKNIEYWVTCRVGIRAYIGYRQLVQAGFKAKLISGGYLTFRAFQQVAK